MSLSQKSVLHPHYLVEIVRILLNGHLISYYVLRIYHAPDIGTAPLHTVSFNSSSVHRGVGGGMPKVNTH